MVRLLLVSLLFSAPLLADSPESKMIGQGVQCTCFVKVIGEDSSRTFVESGEQHIPFQALLDLHEGDDCSDLNGHESSDHGDYIAREGAYVELWEAFSSPEFEYVACNSISAPKEPELEEFTLPEEK